jgi:allantoinase
VPQFSQASERRNQLSTVQEHDWTFNKMAQLLSSEPAKVAGLSHRKGLLAAGLDADIVVWHPYAPTNTSQAGCFHRTKLTPYKDLELFGRVQATFVEGAIVYSERQGHYDGWPCGCALAA